jgi:alkylation response protein AidB-like acyl-CoA dehydrogenase
VLSPVVDSSLLVLLRDGAVAADRAGALAPAAVDALDVAGLWRLQVPAVLGGCEASLLEQYDVVAALARADGAAAWLVAFVGIGGAWPAARLTDEGVADVAPDGVWPRIAGTFPITGRGERVDEGWRVTGRWGCASGITIADWAACGFLTDAGPRWAVVPAAEVVVHDTWDATGLRATASHDYSLDEVVVPERRSFGVADPPRRGGAVYGLPILAFLTPHHTAVTLGSARRALDALVATTQGRQRLGSSVAVGDRGAFRCDLGRIDTMLRAAQTLVRDVLARIDDAVATSSFGPDLLADARTAATWAAEVAVDVATFAHRNGGRATLAAGSTVELAYRDVLTSSQHVHVTDEVYEAWAAALLAGDGGAR